MKRASLILAIVFGAAFLGATLTNGALVLRARAALASASGGTEAGAAPRPERYHLALVVPSADDSFFSGLIAGVEEEAAASGAACQVFRYASPPEAERWFDIALRARLDGLVMYAPRDARAGESATGLAGEAARNGVVFIPVGTDAPPSGAGPYIGSGALLQGREGGRIIGRRLGGGARVGLILQAGGAGAEDPMYRGLASALAAYPGAVVAAVAEAQSGPLSGEAAAQAMLLADPRINAILCSSARDTVGAAQVLVDRGEVGRVMIVGADESPDIERYLDKGVVAASVVRDSRRIGQEAVRAFVRAKQGGAATGPFETGFLRPRYGRSP